MKKICTIIISVTILSIFLGGCGSMYMETAKIYIQQRNWGKASENLRTELEKNPTNAQAHFLLGQVYAEMDSHELMAKEFYQAEELDPGLKGEITKWRQNEWVKVFNNGIQAGQNNNFKDALMWTKKAVIIDTTNANGFKNLGYFYHKMDTIAKALKAYQKAEKLDPENDYKLGMTIALLYTDEGQLDKAKAKLQALIQKDPDEVGALIKLAEIYEDENNEKKALELYKQVIEKDTKDEISLLKIGTFYYKQDKYEEALEAFNKALDIHEDLTEETDEAIARDQIELKKNIATHKAACLNQLEKYEEALDILKTIINEDPYYIDAVGQLIISYAKIGKTDEAKLSNAFYEGLLEIDEGDLEAAKEHLLKALTYNPNHVPTLTKLKEVYEKLGDTEKTEEIQAKIDNLK